MLDNLIGFSLIIAIIHFMFIFQITMTVKYTKGDRYKWHFIFAGNIIQQISGVVCWLDKQKQYGYMTKVRLSFNGLVCKINTHCKDGWEQNEIKEMEAL
jgi:hypothetical protein